METGEITIKPLDAPFGAEVTGVDVSRDLSESVRDRLAKAWHAYSLLVFHDQTLDEQQQLRFATTFGEISKEYNTANGINYVSNTVPGGQNPYGGLGFHFDHSFLPVPLRGIMLYAIECPPPGEGGETLFANAQVAYDSLSQPLKERMEGLFVRHGNPDLTKGVEMPGLRYDVGMRRADHPLAFTHPVTGKKIIFVSPRHADRILELPQAQSTTLIRKLADSIYKPEFQYKHPWRPGDIVVWDNLALQHGRADFDRKWKRHVRRLQIGPA